MEKWFGVVGGAVMFCFVATFGFAGEQPEMELDTMTVTAQKQEQNVQQVPISMSVFSEQDVEEKNIDSITELADFVPNLMIYSHASGMNSPSMRGIHASPETLTTSTGLFIDGVPVLSAIGFDDALLDIERVEVLRGPQGTLYGKNTEAGAINIVTRQPGNEVVARVAAEAGMLLSAETGDRIKGRYSLNASGPLVNDKLFFGLAGQYYHKDGFIENTRTGDPDNDRANWSGRMQLRWTPTDRLDVSLIVSGIKYDDGSVDMNLAEAGTAMFMLPPFEDRKVASNLAGYNKADGDTEALKIAYSLTDRLTLTSISTRRMYHEKSGIDWDFSPWTLLHSIKDNKYIKLSQEVRLDSSSDKLKWLLGFYYDNDDNDIGFEQDSMIPSMQRTTDREFNGDAYAVFGQVGYFLTERLRVVGGLRYGVQEQEYIDHVAGTKYDDSWNNLSPKVAVEFYFTPDVMAYVSASKGYRSGGFNTVATDPQYRDYDEEELWSYEIGLKSALFNNRLILNGAVYYMDIDDMQVYESISPTMSFLTNAAKATAIGVEGEMRVKITNELTAMAGFCYNDIEFDEFSDALGDYKDNETPYAPEYSFNIGAQYRHGSGFYSRVDLIGYGEMFLDRANEYSRDAYEIVNLKIGYETEHYDIYLYGKNIFDEEYNSEGYYDGFYTLYSEPGEVGLQATFRL